MNICVIKKVTFKMWSNINSIKIIYIKTIILEKITILKNL